jgi:hypothetical protein
MFELSIIHSAPTSKFFIAHINLDFKIDQISAFQIQESEDSIL